MNTCKALKKNGEQCRVHPMTGSDYCYFHNADLEKERLEASSRGGKTTNVFRAVNYILVMNGHLINNQTGRCLLCKDEDGDWCVNGMEADQLQYFIKKKPYIYVVVTWIDFLGRTVPTFAVMDTTREKKREFNVRITSNFPMPKLPKLGRRKSWDSISQLQMRRMIGGMEAKAIAEGRLEPSPSDAELARQFSGL